MYLYSLTRDTFGWQLLHTINDNYRTFQWKLECFFIRLKLFATTVQEQTHAYCSLLAHIYNVQWFCHRPDTKPWVDVIILLNELYLQNNLFQRLPICIPSYKKDCRLPESLHAWSVDGALFSLENDKVCCGLWRTSHLLALAHGMVTQFPEWAVKKSGGMYGRGSW